MGETIPLGVGPIVIPDPIGRESPVLEIRKACLLAGIGNTELIFLSWDQTRTFFFRIGGGLTRRRRWQHGEI